MRETLRQAFPLYSLSWIEIIGLQITPDLLGAEISFDLDGHRVRIHLPTMDICNIPKDKNGDDRIEFHAWKDEDGKRIPIFFDVLKICIELNVLNTPSLPTELLSVQNNAYEFLSPEDQQVLDRLTFKHEVIANQAFDIWSRTLRWKSGNGSIGRADISHSKARSARFYEMTTKKCIWVGGSGFTIHGKGRRFITQFAWNEASRALLTYLRPPSYVDLFFDGEEHLQHGYLARCVIDFATSAEILLRRNLQAGLPSDLQQEIIDKIIKSNITDIFPKYGPTIFGKMRWPQLKNEAGTIRELFTKRNLLVHHANSKELSVESCELYRLTLAKFISIFEGEQFYPDTRNRLVRNQ